MRILTLLLALFVWVVPSAQAQGVLTPEEVARSSAQAYPEILAAVAERRAAFGERTEALGAFDTVFSSEARSRLEGYYSGDYARGRVSRPFGPLGAEVYGQYRVSEGDFPIYEDEYFTNEAGEAKIGVLFSLLRDRAIDDRRFGVRQANLGVARADLELLLTRIGVQQRALTAYYRWVAAGFELEAYRELLRLAERREVALKREVESGARAAIFLTENAQNLTRRRELVRRAERDLALAANALSLFLRDDDGEPIIPAPEQLPNALPQEGSVLKVSPQQLLAQRPDLLLLDVARERIENRMALARNDLQPRLDVKVEAANDFGAIGPGGVSRDPAEVIAGVTLSVPFGRREAKGRLRAAEAELDALEQETRLLRDRIRRELRDIVVDLEAAEDVLELTKTELEQANIMRDAEVQQFRSGASDFFLVNLREQAAADAQVRLAQAALALATSRVTYQAATLDADALGLRP